MPACSLDWNYISKRCSRVPQYGVHLQLMCAGVIVKFYIHKLMELWVSLGVVLASSFQFKDEETENIDFAITECIYFF